MKLFVSLLITTIVSFATSAWLFFNAAGIYKAAYGPSVIKGNNGTQDLVYKGDVQVGADLTPFYIFASITLVLLVATIVLGVRYKKISRSSEHPD